MEACDATQAVLRGGELVSAFLQGSHVEEDTPAECRRKGKGVVLASLLRPERASWSMWTVRPNLPNDLGACQRRAPTCTPLSVGAPQDITTTSGAAQGASWPRGFWRAVAHVLARKTKRKTKLDFYFSTKPEPAPCAALTLNSKP